MMSFHFYSVSLPNDFWAMNENTFFFSYKKKYVMDCSNTTMFGCHAQKL